MGGEGEAAELGGIFAWGGQYPITCHEFHPFLHYYLTFKRYR